jgi:hypothetical protein
MVPRRRTRAARAATAVVGGDGNDEIYAFNAMSAPGGTAFGGDDHARSVSRRQDRMRLTTDV